MLRILLHVVLVTFLRSCALRLISLKFLIFGFVVGLNAASFTAIVSLAGLLSKSIAPPVPAFPVKIPERVASVPKKTGST